MQLWGLGRSRKAGLRAVRAVADPRELDLDQFAPKDAV